MESWKNAHLQAIGLQEAKYTNIHNKIKGIRNLSRKDADMIASIDPFILGKVIEALAPMYENVNEALEDGAGENSAAVQYAKDTPGQDVKEDGHVDSANVKNQLTSLKRNAEQLLAQVKPESEYPSWWVNKLVKAADYLDSATDFLQNKVDQGK